MFAFLGSGALNNIGELLAPVKSPAQQLHAAIEENQNDKAMKLIQEGVYYNSPDSSRDDALPIHTACKAGNRAMLDTMMEMGADVNAKDRSGNIPLHAAAKAGKVELVKYLVSLGADVGRRNSYRQTPYDVATSHIIRQYLLPLQLRAEPEPEPGTLASVHNPDIIRDYSNLAPPPTFNAPGQYNLPPPQPPGGAIPNYSMKSSGYHDPAVIRPIAADGFHCSVGNPELAAKYGHIKATPNIAAPPPGASSSSPTLTGDAGGAGVPRPQANPTQYSAFAAYGGRPPPRYVTYNATNNTSAPFMNPNANVPYGSSGGISPVPPPPYGGSPNNLSPLPIPGQQHPHQQQPPPMPPQQQQQQPSYGGQPPSAGVVRNHVISPPMPQPQQQAVPFQGPSSLGAYPTTQPYMGAPPPPNIARSAPSSGSASAPGIPTLPAPNTISVFQPLADNGDDAIELDGSVSNT